MIYLHPPEAIPETLGTMGLGALTDAVSCIVTRRLQGGVCEMEMEYKTSARMAALIQPDCLLMAKAAPHEEPQPWRIDKVTRKSGASFRVYAVQEAARAKSLVVMPFTAANLTAALEALPANIVGPFPFQIFATFSSSAPFSVTVPTLLQDVLMEAEGSLTDVYGGEWYFDGYSMRFQSPADAADFGMRIAYGKNLIDAKQEALLRKCLTGIVPYWYKEDVGLRTLPEQVVSIAGLTAYPHYEPMDFTEDFPSIPSIRDLRNAANRYIGRNNVFAPEVSLSVSFVDIQAETPTIEPVQLGQNVTVQFPAIGIDTKARIVGYTYDVLRDRYTKMEIGKSRQTFAETIAALIKGG